MIEVKDRLSNVADREKWAARGASFVAKAKATKMVWFPPGPTDAGGKAAATARKATKQATKRTTGAAKKTSRATKKTPGAKKASGSAKKTASGAKKAARSATAKKK
jgi:hypothetical protein